MNEFIKQNWFKLIILVIIILTIGELLYWFQIRPKNIIKNCWKNANELKLSIIKSENDLELNGFPITKRANYDKIFKDDYKECLLKNSVEK